MSVGASWKSAQLAKLGIEARVNYEGTEKKMKPLCDIALRYKLGDILIKHEDKPDEIFKAAAAYDIHGKKLGLVTAVMHEGASASLMHGAPHPGEGERWQWLEKGREQVEQLLKERPELESGFHDKHACKVTNCRECLHPALKALLNANKKTP